MIKSPLRYPGGKSRAVNKILNKDIKDVDWGGLKRPDWLHASPPCVNASRANNGTETQEDMELAEAICRAIAIL